MNNCDIRHDIKNEVIEENDEEEKIINDKLQIEFENLQISVIDKCKEFENCVFLKKLSIMKKYNLSKMNLCCDQINNSPKKLYSSPKVSDSSKSLSSRHLINLVDISGEKGNLVENVYDSFIYLDNEEIFKIVNNVIYLHNTNQKIEGTMILTNYRIIFNPNNSNFYKNEFVLPNYLQIPYTFIVSITTKKEKFIGQKHILKLKMKDRPDVNFGFKVGKDCDDLNTSLNDMINPKNINSFFAFKYYRKYEEFEFMENQNGWNIYQHILEYLRLGINIGDRSYRNYIQELDGEICDSYPNFIYIHSKVTNQQIVELANFRTKKRFPVLTWKSSLNNSSIYRSSQAKTGITNKRSTEDESFFQLLLKETEKLHIYDCRPYINAWANKMKGLGYENTDHYKNANLFFCDIDNIHGVKLAYEKVRCISQLPLYNIKSLPNFREGYDNWLIDLHQTNWLQMISKIIKSSVNMASSIFENATVLVHCSDGWDRTSQLCSLSQIIIDPYYRTIRGLIVLIEKDWISFGYKFATRCGHSFPKHENQTSPIFFQWLDCLHQFITQFPDLFEFNINLLLFIAHHNYSCMYGTFLMDNEKERVKSFIKFKTVSIWTDIVLNIDQFKNVNFNQSRSDKTTLTPSCALYKLRLWEEYFLRWNPYYVMNNSHLLISPYV